MHCVTLRHSIVNFTEMLKADIASSEDIDRLTDIRIFSILGQKRRLHHGLKNSDKQRDPLIQHIGLEGRAGRVEKCMIKQVFQ